MNIDRQARRHRRHGAVVVEAAIVLPLMLMFLLGIMEFGRYFMTVQLFNNAVREGAEYAVKHTDPVVLGGTTYGNATTDVTNVVTSFLAGQTLTSQSTQVYLSDSLGNNIGTWTNATAGQYVCVQITGTYKFALTSFLKLPSTVSLTFRAVMRSEGN